MRRRLRSESGASAVEFALVVPLLVVLVAGIIDFGWGFGESLSLRSAVRETARMAVVNQSSSSLSTLLPTVSQRAPNLDPSRLGVAVTIVDTSGPNGTAGGVLGDVGDTVVVCATYQARSITGLGHALYPFPSRYTTQMAMRIERGGQWVGSPATWGSWSGTCALR